MNFELLFLLGIAVNALNFTTLYQKHMVGYQGWFECPNDGFGKSYKHWYSGSGTKTLFDYWPDLKEFKKEDLCELNAFQNPDGSPSLVFSSHNQNVVNAHFNWMQKYNIDGVFLQQFISNMDSDEKIENRLQVTKNIRNAAEKYGRAWSIMFDLSSSQNDFVLSRLQKIWSKFANEVKNSPNYIHHDGKPVVAVWGVGFTTKTRTLSIDINKKILNYLKSEGFFVIGGVPPLWRTQGSEWKSVFKLLDGLSPWSVGKYNIDQMSNLKADIIADTELLSTWNILYLPVLYPGFSWWNLKDGAAPLNSIPRYGGKHYFDMAKTILSTKPKALYTAMFDEVNEGTAIMKVQSSLSKLPTPGKFNYLNIDGINLPSDWYMKLAGMFTKALRGKEALPNEVPKPQNK